MRTKIPGSLARVQVVAAGLVEAGGVLEPLRGRSRYLFTAAALGEAAKSREFIFSGGGAIPLVLISG